MKFHFYIFLLVFSIFSFSQAQYEHAWQNLMPQPQDIHLQKGQFVLDSLFTVAIPDTASRRVQIAATKFIRRLTNRTGLFVKHGFPLSLKEVPQANIVVHYNRTGNLQLHEDEAYQLKITAQQINIEAGTDLGVVFAFETLLQLLDNDHEKYFFQNLTISDKPAFTWRGLMIDAARHFQPVAVIKRNLDAMLVAKLNTFHWHLSDDQGFRIAIKAYPQLTQKASDGQFYTQAQIKDVIQYAADRGIRVIPEIDVPGHATALLTALPDIASRKKNYQLQRNAGIFDPTLDPTNPQTYKVLDKIFKEIAGLFPFAYIHIGGDENRGRQWDANPEIQAFMRQKGLKNNHELQTYFNVKLEKILQKYHKKMMGWEEIRTPQMPKTALIHVWRGRAGVSLTKTVKSGYDAVLSNGFYIDLMLPAATHYQTQLYPKQAHLTIDQKAHILGGEATMWSELVTPFTIDSRIWPRTLAIGERLWSNPSGTNLRQMYQRLFAQGYHLEELGITHIKNRGVILRNIAQNQDISTLQALSRLYEPLKGYKRNKAGTEYQSYSPFMLFADACSADAEDALRFGFLVEDYLKQPNSENKRKIVIYLKKWQHFGEALKNLHTNPKLELLRPMSRSLANLAKDLNRLSLEDAIVNQAFVQQLQADYKIAFKAYNDVSLALKKPLNILIKYWLKQKGYNWSE